MKAICLLKDSGKRIIIGCVFMPFLLVALLRNSLGIQCLALKPLMYLCLTSQCDMEVGAKGRHWADRNWLSAVRG